MDSLGLLICATMNATATVGAVRSRDTERMGLPMPLHSTPEERFWSNTLPGPAPHDGGQAGGDRVTEAEAIIADAERRARLDRFGGQSYVRSRGSRRLMLRLQHYAAAGWQWETRSGLPITREQAIRAVERDRS
jgi:hypothetical protein